MKIIFRWPKSHWNDSNLPQKLVDETIVGMDLNSQSFLSVPWVIRCFSMVDFWNAYLGALLYPWLRRAQPEVESFKNRPTKKKIKRLSTWLNVSTLRSFTQALIEGARVVQVDGYIMVKDRHRPGSNMSSLSPGHCLPPNFPSHLLKSHHFPRNVLLTPYQ